MFNNAASSWSKLVTPWFTVHSDPDLDWAAWRRADPDRRLVISQALVPDGVPSEWRMRAARGDYDAYAVALAEHLVAAGLGDSVIRLSHEANWTQSKDGLGPDPALFPAWRDAWRRFALAMSSVEDAAFLFDWTVNPGVRPVAFDEYYPGDDVVDIIGVDIYDFWDEARLGPAPADPQARWRMRFDEPRGAAELIAFAAAHGKPLSIPEWGVASNGFQGGIGDNPSFVRNIADLVDDHQPIYQAYFAKSVDALLVDASRSFAVYRDAFDGDASTVPGRAARRHVQTVPTHAVPQLEEFDDARHPGARANRRRVGQRTTRPGAPIAFEPAPAWRTPSRVSPSHSSRRRCGRGR